MYLPILIVRVYARAVTTCAVTCGPQANIAISGSVNGLVPPSDEYKAFLKVLEMNPARHNNLDAEMARLMDPEVGVVHGWLPLLCAAFCVLCAVCRVLCAVCCVLCVLCCVLCACIRERGRRREACLSLYHWFSLTVLTPYASPCTDSCLPTRFQG